MHLEQQRAVGEDTEGKYNQGAVVLQHESLLGACIKDSSRVLWTLFVVIEVILRVIYSDVVLSFTAAYYDRP